MITLKSGKASVARWPRAAFSLVEMIVVIGVIGVLMAMLLPALASSRESAKTLQCQSNLRQIGQALFEYANMYKGACRSGRDGMLSRWVFAGG